MRDLDTISSQEKNQKSRRLQTIFKRYVILALSFHLSVTALTLVYLNAWWKSGYTVVLFVRGLVVVRILLLFRVLSIQINVLSIFGVNNYYKIIRHFKGHPSLGLWLLIGFVDLYLVRSIVPWINLSHFLFKGPVHTIQFPAYFLLDSLYLLDFYVTLYWIYYAGVRRNITANLLDVSNAVANV